MAAVEWWTANDSWSMAGWVFGGFCLIVAWVSGERCRMWSKRCKSKDKTIRRMRAADENRRVNARALPAAPKRPVPAPRTRFRWIWPGDNTGRLPVPYGTERETLEAAPVKPQRRPCPPWLREWLEEDQAFLATTRELVLIEGLARNIEWANPPTWVVPHLQEVARG